MRANSESALNVIWNLMVRVVVVLALAYVVWRVRSILVAVILAVMLAYVLLPPVNFLCRRRFLPLSKRGCRLAATIIVFVAFFFIVGIAADLLFTPLKEEAVNFAEGINDYTVQAQKAFVQAKEWYQSKLPADWRAFLEKQDVSSIGASTGNFVTKVIQGTIEWFSHIVEVLLIPVLAFYFVLDSRSLKRELIGLVPPWRIREAMRITRKISGILQSYVIGQLVLCVLAGVITAVVLRLVGMNYVLVLAVLAGVTRAIPILGPIISGVPIVALGALQSMSLGVWLLVFVTIMHFVESKFIMPVLIGDRVKLHPAVILIVLLIGAEFFGVLGMFLAAPIAAIIRELLYLYIVRPRQSKGKNKAKVNGRTPDLVRSERM